MNPSPPLPSVASDASAFPPVGDVVTQPKVEPYTDFTGCGKPHPWGHGYCLPACLEADAS